MEPSSVPATGKTDGNEGGRAPLVERYLTKEGESPWNLVEWERRDARPGVEESKWVDDVEVPVAWSRHALDITAKLYLARGDEYQETSIRQLVHRVVRKITDEGLRSGYWTGHSGELWKGDGSANDLVAEEEANIFYDELVAICLLQLATFNSPVWFNIGRDDRPQCPSACFILDVDDTTESIMDWVRDEARIFKAGSGSGVNPSRLRGSTEALSTGGVASGPISFMRISNAAAETIKSGGTTRRAAKIVQLDADHPDIEDFIDAKAREEERLRVLSDSGFNISFDLEGERNVAELTSFQSANNSVRVTDEFMRQAQHAGTYGWSLEMRKSDVKVKIDASELLDKMAHAVHVCGDPGMMFHDTINLWHTTPEDSPILCTNPCGELHTPNVSSCNLASLNTLKFLTDSDQVDVAKMRHVVDVMTLAMDILVDFCELPTGALTRRTKEFRWLGLGFTNMGAAIMAQGYPYDSDEARDFAASFMALECGRSYRMSAFVAGRMRPFDGFAESRDSMLRVIERHASHVPDGDDLTQAWEAASEDWYEALSLGREHGYRNAQATVIPPAGTTSFFLDCDTTGIEPAFSLVTHKALAGGGSMRIVNGTVERALLRLGYHLEEDHDLACIEESGYPDVLAKHRSIFAGANDISAEGHIRMIAAVQPFISGAASKTINLPSTSTPKDIRECYELAWRLGVKCISIYRDGCKARQVLSVKEGSAKPVAEMVAPSPTRQRLPRTRRSIRHKISVRTTLGDVEGYVSPGVYDDGTIGEMFVEGFGRMGGFQQNSLTAWATAFSVGLQYGVPFEVLVRKHVGHSDETGGMVIPTPGEPLVIRSCSSIIDYIARWLVSEFGTVDLQEEMGVMTDVVKARKMVDEMILSDEQIQEKIDAGEPGYASWSDGHASQTEISAHSCPECHEPLRRAGTCWQCSCGYSTGCG